jgi:hypothetical protein
MAMSSLIKIEMGVPHIILKVGQLKIISAFWAEDYNMIFTNQNRHNRYKYGWKKILVLSRGDIKLFIIYIVMSIHCLELCPFNNFHQWYQMNLNFYWNIYFCFNAIELCLTRFLCNWFQWILYHVCYSC